MGLLTTIFVFLQNIFANGNNHANKSNKIFNKRPVHVARDDASTSKNSPSAAEESNKLMPRINRESDDSSETATVDDSEAAFTIEEPKTECDERRRYGPRCHIFSGLLLSTLGVCSMVWTPFELLMNERLRMRPGLPAFEWWRNPPDEVFLKVYVFNVTNSEEFVAKRTNKLQLEEIGPIIYREKLVHTNVVFNANSTLSYTAVRTPIYLPDYNDVDLSEEIVVPNFPILGMASYLWNAPFFVKIGFDVLARSHRSSPFLRLSIGDYLWNFTDPVLKTANSYVPQMVPVQDMGMLSRIYSNFVDNITIYMGDKYGHEMFSLIDNYDGSIYLPGLGEACERETVVNATEGVTYAQYLQKTSLPRYWRKTMCKVFTLQYSGDNFQRYGLKAYKYELPATAFDNSNAENVCYATEPPLPDGLLDISKCYFDYPVATSYPHFLYADPSVYRTIDGMRPNVTQHSSFAIVEPTTGIALTQTARSQSNLIMRPMSGFSDYINMFGGMVLPMFWAEYTQAGLPWNVHMLMFFTVNVLPYLQVVMTTAMFLMSSCLFYKFVYANKKRIYAKSTSYEQELFLVDNKL